MADSPQAAGLVADIQRALTGAVNGSTQCSREALAALKLASQGGHVAGAGAQPQALTAIAPTQLCVAARSGPGACGDLHTQALSADLVARRPWLPVGVLRCRPDGFWLCDASGAAVQCVFEDGAAAWQALDSPVLLLRWALPPGQADSPASLDVSSFVQLVEAPRGGQLAGGGGDARHGTLACRVLGVSPVLRVQGAEFCIAEVSVPGEEHSPRHVYLSGPSLALRPVLAGVAGSTRGVALTHVLPRMLFPHDPVARTPVLVARTQSQCFVDAGADDGAVALCTACPTCAAGLTVNGLFVVAYAPEAHASAPWALALRRLAPGEPGSGQQSPAQGWDELLLMPHFLSAAGPGPWLVLPGMRPGALLLVTHAVRTARGCLGATARTNLRVVRFSPALCARPVRLGLGDWATRLQCASLGAALNITRGCLALARKVVTGVEALTPELVESVQCAAAEAAAGPAAVEQLQQARKHLAHARGSIYEELLHPFGALRRLQDADHQAQGRFGDVPLRYRLPAVAELRASMARQWRQRRMAAPHDCCAGWPGDALDGARLGRLVLPLHHVLPASDGDDDDEPAPVVLVARLQQLPDSEDGAPRAGWHLYDATGHLDVALEDGATASHVASSVRTWTWEAQPGERYAVARCFFVAEAPLTGDLAAEPYIYLLCAPADLVHVPRASQGSHCSAVTRIAAPSSVATVRQLLTKSRLPSGVAILAVVVGERVRSSPDAEQAAQLRLRVRDVDGHDFVDMYLDKCGGLRPPGVARGAVVLIHGAHQGVSAAGAVYLAAMPARTRIQLLRGPRPASDGTLDPAPAPTAGMTTLEALYSQPFDGACVRLRVRVVTLMRLNMRWACTQCGCDVPEAFAKRAPGRAAGALCAVESHSAALMWGMSTCATCARPPHQRPPGAVVLQCDCSVVVEDGTGQAECWADGSHALALASLPPDGGPLAAVARAHGRVAIRPGAWVAAHEWDASNTGPNTDARGYGAALLHGGQMTVAAQAMRAALCGGDLVLWARRASARADDGAATRSNAVEGLDGCDPAAAAEAQQAAADAQGIVRLMHLGGELVPTAMVPWLRLRTAAVSRLRPADELRLQLAQARALLNNV